uniref:Apple domain-containing protein n=1 Tax=Chromera velia CCMP2878 TaxID=1169474 RepID=A0A0G4HH89_9ALVE|mmetsp:Transcript_11125/g.21489  ORF Transcript_11125/g.21489 Transcript_11125/m.21489 type:complete len:552 (-) Transcript_11125:297-1952(-)|eukprot:Cvel_27420.t1-p1 / transcript=Cvel_27420.t1 / gene=Cvel_27420 / organism=Chromera_velia_CCMP2878 / gene_product=hypothetical protein / transcript_product=hypothetical protein / location=Cvel_scaffold3418:700-2352(-) / protein_length=551 / sequence_SO=supercontig / SO=protein_coding / is_pseudo=false
MVQEGGSRRVPWILGLCFFLLQRFALGDPDNAFCMQLGWKIGGVEMITLEGIPDPRDCQQECQFFQGCMFWRWRGRRECVLMSSPNGDSEWDYSVAHVSGPRTCYVPFSDFPESANAACKVVGLQLIGNEYDTIWPEAGDNADCQEHCSKDPRCNFWSWEAPQDRAWRNQKCHLFASEAQILQYATSIRFVSGPKKCPSSLPQFPIWRSKKTGDVDRKLPWPKVSPEEGGRRHLPFCVEWGKRVMAEMGAAYKVGDKRDCKALCSLLSGCASWTWFAAGELAERCEFFYPTQQNASMITSERLDATVDSPFAVSGPQDCQDPQTDFPEYSQMACARWGVRVVGRPLREFTLRPEEVPEDCMILCQDTEGCVSFSFSVADSNCTLMETDTGVEDAVGVLSGPPLCQDRPDHYSIHKVITRTPGFTAFLEALPIDLPPQAYQDNNQTPPFQNQTETEKTESHTPATPPQDLNGTQPQNPPDPVAVRPPSPPSPTPPGASPSCAMGEGTEACGEDESGPAEVPSVGNSLRGGGATDPEADDEIRNQGGDEDPFP